MLLLLLLLALLLIMLLLLCFVLTVGLQVAISVHDINGAAAVHIPLNDRSDPVESIIHVISQIIL